MISSPNSYFTAEEGKVVSKPVFIITLDGDYEVPQADIIDPGTVTSGRPGNFSDIISGTHSFILNNSTGLYSPGKSTFIWTGETWYRRSIKIEMGYVRSGTVDTVDKITIYEGLITGWEVREEKDYSFDAPSQGVVVEISSTDIISLLSQHQIGMPDDDGTPHPVLYGKVFKPLLELGDYRQGWTTDQEVNFDAGDLTGITPVTSGSGTVTASSTQHYTGGYSAKCEITDSTDVAQCQMDGGGSKDEFLTTAMVYIDTMPGALPSANVAILTIQNAAYTELFRILIETNGDMNIWDASTETYQKVNWNAYESQGKWVRVSLSYRKAPPGLYGAIRLYLNGEDIYTKVTNWPNTWRYVLWGLKGNSTDDLHFIIYYDKLQLDYQTYSYGYYLPGYPFLAIDSVYSDGAIYPKQQRIIEQNLPYINAIRERYKAQAIARFFPYDQYDAYPDYGLIDCLHIESMPSGTFFAEMEKDTVDHPVDIIDGLLTEAGLDSYIDDTNFSACKTAMPDDIIGAYFESTTCAQAISDVTRIMLYDLMIKAGKLCLIPYTGNHLVSSVKTLDQSNCYSMKQTFSMEEIKTGVTVKWGWYEKDNSLFYRHDDTSLQAILGDITEEMDMSYGADVSSKDGDTARAKADLYLKRLSGAIDTITANGNLSLIRIEIGDGVTIQNTNINDSNLIYEVTGKTIDLTNKVVELTAVRYEGES